MKAAGFVLALLAATGALAADRTAGDELVTAIERGDLLAVKALIQDGGLDPDTPITYGESSITPLMKASERGKRDIVKYLLSKGAKVNAKDGDGDTPLHLAARQDAVEILAILLKYGADTKAKNRPGETPLDTAHRSYRARAEDALRAASAAAPAGPARSGAPAPKP